MKREKPPPTTRARKRFSDQWYKRGVLCKKVYTKYQAYSHPREEKRKYENVAQASFIDQRTGVSLKVNKKGCASFSCFLWFRLRTIQARNRTTISKTPPKQKRRKRKEERKRKKPTRDCSPKSFLSLFSQDSFFSSTLFWRPIAPKRGNQRQQNKEFFVLCFFCLDWRALPFSLPSFLQKKLKDERLEKKECCQERHKEAKTQKESFRSISPPFKKEKEVLSIVYWRYSNREKFTKSQCFGFSRPRVKKARRKLQASGFW